jgi:hypothetical protein
MKGCVLPAEGAAQSITTLAPALRAPDPAVTAYQGSCTPIWISPCFASRASSVVILRQVVAGQRGHTTALTVSRMRSLMVW